MRQVTAVDVAKVLASEFPGTGILGRGDTMTFRGAQAKACRRRAEELMIKAQLFNAHLDLGHIRRFTATWHKRV